MKRIDAHQHFWQYDPVKDAWITTEMQAIRRDFMPEDLQPVLERQGLDGCIAVQASQSEAETGFLLTLASRYDFISGVVGWTDLKAADVSSRLQQYAGEKKLSGFRHLLQGEDIPAFLADGAFSRGIGLLKAHGFTYDLLVYHHQLKDILPLVEQHPEQDFVLDHMGKPDLKTDRIDSWRKNMNRLASHPNVYCKISGLITEGDLRHWKEADLLPYLDICVDAFTTERLLFGSDWPVCLVATPYAGWHELLQRYFQQFTVAEQSAFFGGNAVRFYGID